MDKITPMPIGIEFYKEMITKGYYYVDKTLLIWDLLAYRNKVTLFTRPRRFGKTLAQSMVKTFFEKEVLPDGTVADNSVYFQGKKIMYAREEYLKHMGQYPICTNLAKMLASVTCLFFVFQQKNPQNIPEKHPQKEG